MSAILHKVVKEQKHLNRDPSKVERTAGSLRENGSRKNRWCTALKQEWIIFV